MQYKQGPFGTGHEAGDNIQEKVSAIARIHQLSWAEVTQGHTPNTSTSGMKELKSTNDELVQWVKNSWTMAKKSAGTLDIYLQKCQKAKSLSTLKEGESVKNELHEATPLKQNKLQVVDDKEEKKKTTIIRDLPTSVQAIVEENSREFVVKGDGPCLLRVTAAHISGDEEEGPQLARDLNTHQSEYRQYYKAKIVDEFPQTITLGTGETTKKFENSREYFDWLQESAEAAYMWRHCVDVIAISNMANMEIDVVVYEEGKLPETRQFKPDPEFPWKEEDPMKPVSAMKTMQGKMVVINWKNTHFNLIVGPDHMLYQEASLRLEATGKLGIVAEGAKGQPDNSQKTPILENACCKISQFQDILHQKNEKIIDAIVNSNCINTSQETVGAKKNPSTLIEKQISKQTRTVVVAPTKIGPGPRKGRSQPAKKNNTQKGCDPRFYFCDPWPITEKVHIPLNDCLSIPTTKLPRKKKKLAPRRKEKTKKDKKVLRDLDNWWIENFGKCKVVVYAFNYEDNASDKNYSTFRRNTLLLLHLLSVVCCSRYNPAQPTRSVSSEALKTSPIITHNQNLSAIGGKGLVARGRGLRGGGPTKQTPKMEIEGIGDQNWEEQSMQTIIRLANDNQNLCYTNSGVLLLSMTDIKRFLLTELPCLPNRAISTAQELARLFRTEGEDSADQLRR